MRSFYLPDTSTSMELSLIYLAFTVIACLSSPLYSTGISEVVGNNVLLIYSRKPNGCLMTFYIVKKVLFHRFIINGLRRPYPEQAVIAPKLFLNADNTESSIAKISRCQHHQSLVGIPAQSRHHFGHHYKKVFPLLPRNMCWLQTLPAD